MLDIGPGVTPHPQATVLLEKRYESEEEYRRQCGGLDTGETDRRTVFYDGGRFPFSDGEFDYVICSHVLEHVPDLEGFCAELFRVAKRGYLEYPLVYYDFVYDIPEHVNALKKRSDALVYLPKSELQLAGFAEIQRFWFDSLTAGYSSTVADLVPWLMEGFEWAAPFPVRRATSLRELLHDQVSFPARGAAPAASPMRRALRSLKRRVASIVSG